MLRQLEKSKLALLSDPRKIKIEFISGGHFIVLFSKTLTFYLCDELTSTDIPYPHLTLDTTCNYNTKHAVIK